MRTANHAKYANQFRPVFPFAYFAYFAVQTPARLILSHA